jgi:putative phosphoesterase
VRIAVISDTHLPRGRRALPEACLEHIRASDLLIHAGDVVEAEVLGMLAAIGPPVEAVHGNVDSAELRRLLPETRIVNAGSARIGVIHDAGRAAGRLARMRSRFPDCDAVVFGHSHIPLIEADEAVFQILNPGSPTDRRRQPRHTMAIGLVEGGVVRFEVIALD